MSAAAVRGAKTSSTPTARTAGARARSCARIGPTTATELATAIGLDRTATTRYASRLQAAGLELTPAGHRAVAAMRRMLSTWKRDEAEQFAASLERFTTMLEQRK